MFVPYRVGVVVDGTRKTGDVQCIASELVGVLMNAVLVKFSKQRACTHAINTIMCVHACLNCLQVAWSRMFPGIVASASASLVVPPDGVSRHQMAILVRGNALHVVSAHIRLIASDIYLLPIFDRLAGTWRTSQMDAELMLLSPRVPLRKVKFIRQCRYVAADTWAVIDVSVDGILGHLGGVPPTWTPSRFLPSGCLIQGMSNRRSKVIYYVHSLSNLHGM
jgi:hypothetical protein